MQLGSRYGVLRDIVVLDTCDHIVCVGYGDSSHVHAATASTSGETATYDAAGDMQCRAPTSATTCAGATLTGAHLAYDAERRLTHWQNAPSNPTTQARYLYDRSGNRVEQYVSGGSGKSTYYRSDNVEKMTPSGSLIKYYAAGGMALGLNTARDSSGISYLASDGLGSVSEALSPSGSATGAQLCSPYGGVRYSSGTMPTAKGFTGQYSDAASSGLDYYGARYYDPTLGQFTSADTANDELNRYGYVKGNPETATDPTGHKLWAGGDSGGTPPPNDAGWDNNQDIIEQYAHRGRPPWPHVTWRIDPNRRKSPSPNQARAYAQEEADAEILANYFGLDVIYRDPGSDYVIGVDTYKLKYGWPPVEYGSQTTGPTGMIGATTADLYYPKADTPEDIVRGRIRHKATQSAIVVVDISDNKYLQGLEANDELYQFGQQMTSSGGVGLDGVNRVIFIDNGYVVSDVSYTWTTNTVWGPLSAKQAGATPGYYDHTPNELNR